MGIVCCYPWVNLPPTGKSTRLFFVGSFLHYRPQTDSQVKETGLAPHGDALAIALNERVRGEDDVGIPQEKSHSLSDDGSAIDGVVVSVRYADPAPSVHAEQSQAAVMPHRHHDGGRRVVVVLPACCGPC